MIRRVVWLLALTFPLATLWAKSPEATAPWLKLVIPSEIVSLSLSPDGKHLAGIGQNGYGVTVIVVDVATLKSRDLVKPQQVNLAWIYQRNPTAVTWVADDVLAVDFNDEEAESYDLAGHKLADLGERTIRRLSTAESPSDWALVYTDVEAGSIARVNARTGEKQSFRGLPSGRLLHWAFDASGVLRAVTTMSTAFWSDTTLVRNWYRADDKAEWQLLTEASVTDDYWQPLFVPAEANQLIILSSEGRDTKAVFRYDVSSRKHVELMVGHPTEDILAVTGLEQTVTRVVTGGLRPQTVWFDARRATLQRTVDTTLSHRVNVLSGDPQGLMLVHSFADVDPGRWLLFDTRALTLKEILQANPGIDPQTLRPVETLRYRANDGLEIPAFLTLPSDEKVLHPLVVLIHGGPQARDHWYWDQEVQILAMNGYAVFQPQFRGSSGFGKSFEAAGYGQWGLAMQDDITSGVNHLIERKLVDPNRICIVGASYGGYAALWGVIKTPRLYKCGVSFAGVSDIGAMLKDWSDTNSNAVAREVRSVRLGARGDPARFDAVSPLQHADKVEVPLLLAHGERDKRVPVSHSEKMVDALQAAGKKVEWVPFPTAGHGFNNLRDEKYYYTRVLKFLSENIGPEPKAAE